MDKKVAFIGAGNMAKALIHGLLEAGTNAADLCAADISESQLTPLAAAGVRTSLDNQTAITSADVIVLAVKPQVLADTVSALQLDESQLVVSIAAGIPMDTLQAVTGPTQPIVRCMPNTPALVGAGMAGLFANAHANASHRDAAQTLLAAAGEVVWVEQEHLLDSVTAVSGSGPAYFFYLMEAMIRAGEELGLSEAAATSLTLQTAYGAAKLAQSSSEVPAQLRRNVTSPGGTTERALDIMNEAGVADAIVRALHGAAKRSTELAEEFGR